VPWNGWTETDFRTPMAYTTITRTITYILRLRSGQALRPPGPPDGCRLLHRRVLRVCLRRRRPFRSHSNRLTYSGPGGSHTYTYDAVNRLTSAGGVTYTWDDRGNLTDDGTFTYTTNAAGRLVRAESVTTTLVYTYASTSLSAGTATGLRVAQSVDGDVTEFAWDWASGIPEMLQSHNPQSANPQSLYLVGHETLGQWDGDAWSYTLPDGLGSVRQVTDGAGRVRAAREWTPYGVEVGGAQTGLGYTGEWQDAALGLTYLRARWYDGRTGRFTQRDPWEGSLLHPGTRNGYNYADGNPVMRVDPLGLASVMYPGWIEKELYEQGVPIINLVPYPRVEYALTGAWLMVLV